MNFNYVSPSEEATALVGKRLGERVKLRPEWGRVILLSGSLGAGKTVFAKGFFEGLGVENAGKSPTFTYFQEYPFCGRTVLHGDLFRLRDQPHSSDFILEELRDQGESGNVIILEWADLLPLSHSQVFRDNTISVHIENSKAEDERVIRIAFKNSGRMSEREAEDILEEFATPVHIREHSRAVMEVAVGCGKTLLSQGIPIDLDLIRLSAKCHDLVRYVDFKTFSDIEKYKEEVTKKKLELWKSIQKRFEAFNHGDAAAEILSERGFYANAKVVKSHMTKEIFREEPFSIEEKVVYYADKRVLHNRIVTLDERLADGRIRYAHESNPVLDEKIRSFERDLSL